MSDSFYLYVVKAWKRQADGSRICIAECEVRATNGWDAAQIAAMELGYAQRDWNDGSKSPPIVMRVEDARRARP